MRDLLYMIRFFGLVAPVPLLMVSAMCAVGLAAALLAVLQAERTGALLTPLLLLQIFAASSGFLVPARRGHYDLLLTAGYGRMRIAAAHWAVSVLPGLSVWMLVGAVDAAAVRGDGTPILSSGTGAAFAMASTMPWAATVGLPRFTAAIAWLLVLAVVVAVLPPAGAAAFFDPLDQATPWLIASVGVALHPLALVGVDVTAAQAPRVLPALILAAGCMTSAFVWIGRQDIPLEAPQ